MDRCAGRFAGAESQANGVLMRGVREASNLPENTTMRTLAILARWPGAGHAKTRLAPALTPALAHQLHIAMLNDTLDAARGVAAGRRTLWWAGAPAHRDAFPVPDAFDVFDQGAGDLGDRLAAAFATLHRTPEARVIVIGSDCPWLDAAALDRAFETLERKDAVLGPADDGGFYLIGLGAGAARFLPGLFQEIPWSTERTGEGMLARLGEAGLSLELLPAESDIDVAADVIECLRRALRDPTGAEHTRAALVAMRLLPSRG